MSPNIVLIMTDQQSASAMSCAGWADVSTPAMDRLASSGTRFELACCPQPLCGPARASMFTGLMPSELGITINVVEEHGLPPGVRMIGPMLRETGYDCGYVGKWHLPVPVDRTDLHGFDSVWSPVQRCRDPFVAEECRSFLEKKRSDPFFLSVSFVNPHDICQFARGEELLNGPIGETPPAEKCPSLPGNFGLAGGEPPFLREIQERIRSIHPTADWGPDEWRQYRWAYARLVEKVDREVGRVLKALQESGAAGQTVVVFTSDHGDGMGGHQWNQKQALYEEIIGVPLIIAQPGKTVPGYVDREHLISMGLDLVPTLCDYAGLAPANGLRGRSFRSLAEGATPGDWRRFLVAETEFQLKPERVPTVTGRCVRSLRYKYVAYRDWTGKLGEQFFDLQVDPGETRDLIDKGEHRQEVMQHREALAEWEAEATRGPDGPHPLCGGSTTDACPGTS